MNSCSWIKDLGPRQIVESLKKLKSLKNLQLGFASLNIILPDRDIILDVMESL